MIFLNGYLDNLNRLFSDDDAVSFQALLEKKNWLFRKLFVPIRFDREEIDGEVVYPEIHALSDSAFVFKKLDYDRTLFSAIEYDRALKLIGDFNAEYRFLYLKDYPDFGEEELYAEADMKRIDERAYRELVGNFYPCFVNPEEAGLVFDSRPVELLKLAMVRKNGYVLILGKESLLNDRYYLPVICRLHCSGRIDEEKKRTVEEIALYLNAEVTFYD